MATAQASVDRAPLAHLKRYRWQRRLGLPALLAHRDDGGEARAREKRRRDEAHRQRPAAALESLAASIALPAWLLCHNPALSIVNVTYGYYGDTSTYSSILLTRARRRITQ